MWLGDGDEWLDQQVHAELFAPLLWCLPPEASIDILGESHHRGMPPGIPSGLLAVSQLAREILGLHYDPDATFRREGQRILERSQSDNEAENGGGLYGLSTEFKRTEITFEISTDAPPLAMSAVNDEGGESPVDLSALVARRIATNSLAITGLLGNYEPNAGRVVLYRTAISVCAEKLALPTRHVGCVTLIHETLHALIHLGRDLDGRMWPEFCLPSAGSRLFEPSWFHETLTQYFTYQHVIRLNDPGLSNALELISSRLTHYESWQRLRDLPVEDGRAWLMSVRRGIGSAPLHPRGD